MKLYLIIYLPEGVKVFAITAEETHEELKNLNI